MLRKIIFGIAFSAAVMSQPLAASANETGHKHEHEHEHEHGHAEHVSEKNGVRIIHAWSRATTEKEVLVFFELENESSEAVTLVGGESEIADKVSLVGVNYKASGSELAVLPGVPVQPGAELHLDPESMALRLEGLQKPLAKGDVFEVEVELNIGHLDVDVQVEAENAKNHSHAGHSH